VRRDEDGDARANLRGERGVGGVDVPRASKSVTLGARGGGEGAKRVDALFRGEHDGRVRLRSGGSSDGGHLGKEKGRQRRQNLSRAPLGELLLQALNVGVQVDIRERRARRRRRESRGFRIGFGRRREGFARHLGRLGRLSRLGSLGSLGSLGGGAKVRLGAQKLTLHRREITAHKVILGEESRVVVRRGGDGGVEVKHRLRLEMRRG